MAPEQALGKTASWSDWARHTLVIAAADELGIDPLEALTSVSALAPPPAKP